MFKSINFFIVNENNELEPSSFLLNTLIKYLNTKRYNHSLEVGKLAYKIAKANKLNNLSDFYFAGIAHDIAKNIENDNLYQKVKNLYPRSFKLIPWYAYHAFYGVKMVEDLFSCDNRRILNAIKFHCTGKNNMSCIEKIIYAADKIEPTRGYDSKDLIDSMMCNYKDGFIKVLKENKNFIDSKGSEINNNYYSEKCFKFYLCDK